MPERRQAFRREPIIVELSENVEVLVPPIPWEQRNDFGGEVIRQTTEQVNQAVRLFIEDSTSLPQLEASYTDKFTDAQSLLRYGLPEEVFSALPPKMYYNQIVEILLAICDVNQLEHLKQLIDPNFHSPTEPGGILSQLLEGITSPSPESGLDSSSQDSAETPSENSPTPS